MCIKDVGSLHRGPEANGALSTHPEQSAYPILCLIKRRVVDIFIKARVTRVFWRSKPKSEMISRLCSKGHSFHFQQKRGATYRLSPFVTAAVTKKKVFTCQTINLPAQPPFDHASTDHFAAAL